MVPTLGIPSSGLLNGGFINGYIRDPIHEIEYTDCVYLLFKPTNLSTFREFVDSEYERTKSIIEDYDYEGGYVVIVYKLDMEYADDFQLVKQGKYSQTSPKFQKLFSPVVKIIRNGLYKDELSLQLRVFKKSPDLIQHWENKFDVRFDENQEVWKGWDEKEEILYIDKVRCYVE